MENIGYLALILGFCVAVYSILAGVVGRLRNNAFLELSAQRGVLTVWALTTVASGLLLAAILTDDFRLNYVASYSSLRNRSSLTACGAGKKVRCSFDLDRGTYVRGCLYGAQKHAMISYVARSR
jgi:hypothetical protein